MVHDGELMIDEVYSLLMMVDFNPTGRLSEMRDPKKKHIANH